MAEGVQGPGSKAHAPQPDKQPNRRPALRKQRSAAGSEEESEGGTENGSDSGAGTQAEEEIDSEGQQGPPDPLYDPDADGADEVWVTKQRGGRVSDAILNCPGCFTTLCVDCQAHDSRNQYRAMFTMNCKVGMERTVQPLGGGEPATGKRGRGKEAPKVPVEDVSGNRYHPVSCEVCDTEVGVVDEEDGLYIFYNTFPSNA